MTTQHTTDWLSAFEAIVGAGGVVSSDADLAPHLSEWRGLYRGQAMAMLRPRTTQEIARLVTFCQTERIGIVPQGGNTGLVGGAIAHSTSDAPQVIVSMQRLNRIRDVDVRNYSMTAEAGCVLREVQRAAADHGRFFPLSLAAEGSCQLGGNLATNAGGTNVLRYGNTRDLVLGIEVVLPDGSLLDDLHGLRKDNTGYDVKQLFIGAEGTLGIITAATCKLFPPPRDRRTALVAVNAPGDAVAVFEEAREALSDAISAFELISAEAMSLVLKWVDGTRLPLDESARWYVLLETEAADLEAFLARQHGQGRIVDAAIAQNERQAGEFWQLRHLISEAQKRAGEGIKHDVSVPISKIAAFIEEGESLLTRLVPGGTPVIFGHLGDGNLHFNVNLPAAEPGQPLASRWATVSDAVHTLVSDFGGSFSAEHGIGALKVGELERLADPGKIALMRTLKRALDPHGIMNPGKVLAPRAD